MKYLINSLAFLALFVYINIIPDNKCHLIEGVKRRIPVYSKTGMDEQTFNLIIDHFSKIYEPIVKQKGYVLKINRLWQNDVINADTTVQGKYWVINAYGGLARHEMMDAETYMAVMLHEIGHHLGGYPKKGWATNEGGADYFSTLKGWPLMVENGVIEDIYNAPVPKSVAIACSLQHKSSYEISVCRKIAHIGYKLAKVLNNLSGSKIPIDFDTPDKSEVSTTYNGHPKAQCRLDTYFAGSICGKSYKEELSNDNPCQGACAEECGDKIGIRSHCWYKPKK